MEINNISNNIRFLPNSNNSVNYSTNNNIKTNSSVESSNKNLQEKNFLKKDDVSTSLLNSVIDEANKSLACSKKELSYYIHEESKRVIVKIVDSVTRETIKEIPDKKLLDIICKIQENIGILFNDTV